MFHGFSLNLHPGCLRPCCGTVAGQEESETSEAEPGVEQEPCKIARAELMVCDEGDVSSRRCADGANATPI
jgi:hypothetical protein